MTGPGSLLAVVLAAGGSSRFHDGAKQFAAIDGRPMVARVVETVLAAGDFDAVVVVQGAVDCREVLAEFGDAITVVDNPDWRDGIATSVQVGVRVARERGAEAIVVGLADQPGVGVDDWRAVARVEVVEPIVVARYGGRRGNPVRLERSVWHELPTTGDDGARVVMARRPDLVSEVACSGDASDVDTVEDLERWN